MTNISKKSRCRKKIVFGIIIIFLGLSISPGIMHTVAVNIEKIKSNIGKITFLQDFSSPTVTQNGQFVRIDVEETNSFIAYEEEPMMPFYSKIYEFKPGTMIMNVEISP